MTPQEFWNSTKLWPLVPAADRVVFLAVAMHRIGRAYFDNWHSREPFFPLPPAGFFPRDLDRRDPTYLRSARLLIERYGSGIEAIPLTSFESWRPIAGATADDIVPLTNGEWERAFEIADQFRDFAVASRNRWDELVEATFAFMKFGRLETVLQPVEGGAYLEAPNALWNSDLAHTIDRFAFCTVDLARPFGEATVVQNRMHLIYVRTSTLNRLISDISALKGKVGEVVPTARSLVNSERFRSRVLAEVRANPRAPPEGWSRDRYIDEIGYTEMRLPKGHAKALFAQALRDLTAEGFEHLWSKRRPR